jgi:4-amino-4-deoxy-L-arabinose transferase-like glycosyltransferase
MRLRYRPQSDPAVTATVSSGQVALAALVILAWLFVNWSLVRVPEDLRSFDQPLYLGIAHDLRQLGRFTDGFRFPDTHPVPARPSGMKFMPLYPAFLAGASMLDPGFDRALSCFVEHEVDFPCSQDAPLVRWVQFAMTGAVFLMLWRIGTRVTGSLRVGWLSLGIGLITAPVLLRSVDAMMTETFSLFFITAATAAAVAAAKGSRPFRWLLLSGAMVGLATMTRPAFVYLLPAAAVVGMFIALRRPGHLRGMLLAATFLLGGATVIAPWVARNAAMMSQPALTSGYASMILAQRVAFNQMSWREYALAYLCWLPDGNGMGSLLLGHDACARFQLDAHSDSFYGIGNTTFMQSSIAAAGGPDRQFDYLMHNFVLAQPLWHAAVTIPLALRGVWIDHYWGLVLAALCLMLTLRALRRGDDALLILTLPGWFMLAFHAAVSVNQTRYNLMLIVPFAIAGGIALDRTWLRWTIAHAQPAPYDPRNRHWQFPAQSQSDGE